MNLRHLIARQPFSPLGLAAIAAAIVAALLVWFVIAGWMHARRAAAEGRVGAVMGEAHGKSAAEAGAIIDGAHAASVQSEALSRENADAIRSAQGADQALDPALNDAGRRSLCRRPSYRRTTECVQLLGPS